MVKAWKIHRSWKRASRPPIHSCLWTKRCKTVICTKTPLIIASEISQTIDDWELWDRIAGLCFDATALNAGAKGGHTQTLPGQLQGFEIGFQPGMPIDLGAELQRFAGGMG